MLKIHPAIGIARIGNSPEWFVGPESPGVTTAPSDGNYQSPSGQIRRQGARFRIYKYDTAGAPQEIKPGVGDIQKIEWTVQIANRKAAVDNILNGGASSPRNPGIPQSELIIAPSKKTIDGPGQSKSFNDGAFRGRTVSLGGIESDSEGRLIVLGSQENSDFVLKLGESGGFGPGGKLSFDNNPFWYDTVADGQVSAKVTFRNGTTETVEPAWVIIAPPDYAPGIHAIITMYDLVVDVLLRNFQFNTSIYDPSTTNSDPNVVDPHYVASFQPKFTRDIFPILFRPQLFKWVHKPANGRHATLDDYVELSKSTGQPGANPAKRSAIFNRLRKLDGSTGTMPKLHGDLDGAVYPTSGLTLTRTQYEIMRRWKDGNFLNDWGGIPTPSSAVTPAGLDEAALENCIGGAFFPGIESNRIFALRTNIYQTNSAGRAESIRLKPLDTTTRPAGYLTADNALPWQADFLKCSWDPTDPGDMGWWPSARPDTVFRTGITGPQTWATGIGNHKDMVDKWIDLKFVAKNSVGDFFEQP